MLPESRFAWTRTPETPPWHEVAVAYGVKLVAAVTMLAAAGAVGLVIYYAL